MADILRRLSLTAALLGTTLLLWTASAASVPAGAGVTFRFIGPGNGGSMFGAASMPGNPKVILFGGDMGAMYRSDDGGKSWCIIGGPSGHQPGVGGVWVVQFDPKRPNIAWIGGTGVFKSMDAGITWRRAGDFERTIGALGIDPDFPDVVYAAEGNVPKQVVGWVRGRVWKTTDGGKHWRELPRPGGPAKKDSLVYRNYSRIVIDPNSPVIQGEGHARVYLVGRGGLFRSDDASRTWRDLSAPFGAGQTTDLRLVRREGKSRLFLAVTPAMGMEKGGVYRSDDGGETWKPCNAGLEKIIQRLRVRNKTLKSNPRAHLLVLLLAYSPRTPNRLVAASYQGMARSENLGGAWRQIVPPEGTYAKARNGEYVAVLTTTSGAFKKSIWGGIDDLNRFEASATEPGLLFFTDNQDLYRSTDGGETWTSITFDFGKRFDFELFPDFPPTRYTWTTISRGIQNIVSDCLCLDPFEPKTYYAAYMDLGLEISRDGGRSWAHPTKGTPARGHAWAVAVDPGNKGRVYLSIGLKWGQKGGLYRSDDSGRSWTKIGLSESGTGYISSIAIDLHSPVKNRTLYLSTTKAGIYKSADGGATWRRLTVNGAGAMSVTLDPTDSRILYAGTNAGLWKSADSGRTWQQRGSGLFEKVENLSICRSHPSTLYLCAHLPGKNGAWGETRIWRSDDGGEHFRNLTPRFMKWPGAVAVNPFDPDYIYACNNLMSGKNQLMIIARSRDGGKTWEDIGNGIAFCRGRHILIDPQNPQHFFVHARFGILEGWDRQAPRKP